MDARLPLAADPRSVSRARRFASSTLIQWSLPALRDDVALLVSELVTNAVLHAHSDSELVLLAHPDELRVEVHDDSARLPQQRNYSEVSGTGRGLLLLQRLASSWGSEPTARGKVVWFTVPIASGDSGSGARLVGLDSIEAQ